MTKAENQRLKFIELKDHRFGDILSLKKFTNKKDLLLLYEVSENSQYIFKSSTSKMIVASLMLTDSGHFLAEDSLFLMERMINLTASAYRNLLKKLVPLATMERPEKNPRHVELFGGFPIVLFNFEPTGCVTDLSSSNLTGSDN